MKIRKETPTWFIIADSKINAQSFQKYTDQIDTEYETNWIKANGKAQSVSQSEKLIEVLLSDFYNIKNDKFLPSNEFLTKHFAKLEPLFDHFSATIVFNEVSHLFIQNILLEKLNYYHLNQKRCNDLSMWLPPAFEHPVVASTYGRMIGEIGTNIDNFIQETEKTNVKPEDALRAAFSMMPLAQHSKVVITTTMNNWRKLLLNLTQPHIDIETRYVMIHLCRDLKLRYFGFFLDLALQSQDGQIYGLDSITNEGFWKIAKIIKKP